MNCFQHLMSFPSRPVVAAAATPRHTRGGAAAQPPRRAGRVGPAPAVSERRRGHSFAHLDGANFERAPRSGYAPSLSDAEIQDMWSAAFRNAGVTVSASQAGNRRPARNRTEAQWDRAFVRAGLIKAEF